MQNYSPSLLVLFRLKRLNFQIFRSATISNSVSLFYFCYHCSHSLKMSKVYVKIYNDFKVAGRDFLSMDGTTLRRILLSPDGKHSISLAPLRDGTLLFTNETKVPFEFSVTQNGRVLAVVKYESPGKLLINSNWKLEGSRVVNREIHTNPELKFCDQVNFELNGDGDGSGLLRIDMKLDESGFAAALFSNRDLIFVRMNGNHAVPRLLGLMETKIQTAKQESKQEGKQEGIRVVFKSFIGSK